MTTVVVPIEDTLESWVAVDWCARHLVPGDRVVGVHAACRSLPLAMAGVPPVEPYDGVDEDGLRRLVQPLEEAGLSGDLIIIADQRLCALRQVARAHQADMVVIAKAVRGTVHDLIAGDVASQLVHFLPCPVLVLPACQKVPRRERKRRSRRYDRSAHGAPGSRQTPPR